MLPLLSDLKTNSTVLFTSSSEDVKSWGKTLACLSQAAPNLWESFLIRLVTLKLREGRTRKLSSIVEQLELFAPQQLEKEKKIIKNARKHVACWSLWRREFGMESCLNYLWNCCVRVLPAESHKQDRIISWSNKEVTCYFHTRSAPKDEIVAIEKEKHWGEKLCWTHLRQKLWQCHRRHSLGNHCALVEQPSRRDVVLNVEECGWRIDVVSQAYTLGLHCHGVQFTSLETKSTTTKRVNLANAPFRTRQSKKRKRLQGNRDIERERNCLKLKMWSQKCAEFPQNSFKLNFASLNN